MLNFDQSAVVREQVRAGSSKVPECMRLMAFEGQGTTVTDDYLLPSALQCLHCLAVGPESSVQWRQRVNSIGDIRCISSGQGYIARQPLLFRTFTDEL